MMEIEHTDLPSVVIITPKQFYDSRGWFMESFSQRTLNKLGIDINCLQVNYAFSKERGTLRGLHYQASPFAQSKLIRCVKGSVFDVAVDLSGSAKWVGVELSEENNKMIYIPKGYAHGYVTLCDNVEVEYIVDEFYTPEADRSIRYDDPTFSIAWPINAPIISEKDNNAPYLSGKGQL